MKLFKVIVVMSALMMLSLPAWAGNIPEFDTVGDDSSNFFALENFAQFGVVVQNNAGQFGPVNLYSDFRDPYVDPQGPAELFEEFFTTAGQLQFDPCFGIPSALTDVWNEAIYEWYIVLQMKPESDINLNIYDCVLKHNEFDIFEAAEQTGRYRMPWGELMFELSANPLVSVEAYPGNYPTPAFGQAFEDAIAADLDPEPLILDARTLPGLNVVPMDGQLYTSKAHWTEGIVLKLPKTGETNASGQMEYNLKQGDIIKVKIEIPENNTVDLWYGPNNVILKYIGIIGTWYYAEVEINSGT
jgi:hypothetical protein